MRYKALFAILISLIVLAGFAAAQLPPSPPPPPNLGGNAASTSEEDLDEDFLDEEPELFQEQTTPPNQQSTPQGQERQTEPKCESPAASNVLAYTFITLTVVLLMVIAIILFLWKKDKDNFVPAHPQSMDQLQTKSSIPITPASTEATTPAETRAEPRVQSSQDAEIKTYIDQCRAQGYNDDAIKFELLRNGHSADELNKFFNN